MANSFTFEKRYAARFQDILKKTLVSDLISNFRLESNLSFGQTVDRFKADFSGVKVRSEVRTDTARSVDSVSDTAETLTVDQSKYMGLYLHNWDKMQKQQNLPEIMAKQLAIKMRTKYDGNVLNETKNAYDTLDAGDIGGTNGVPVAFNTTNVPLILTNGTAKLRAHNVDEMNMVHIVDPLMTAVTEQYLIGKSIDMAGGVFKNGYVGQATRNLAVHESNSLTSNYSLAFGTNPTANDTITIGQVVFKFVASPSAAGDIDIGSDAAGSLANLVVAINGGAGAGTAYVEVSTANRVYLQDTIGAIATDNTTALGLECVGGGRVTCSETLTAAGDIWSATANYLSTYLGKKGSVDVVRQSDVAPMTTNPADRPRITYFWSDMLWGKKTFDDGKQNFLEARIQL
jgi:hypothetical protein